MIEAYDIEAGLVAPVPGVVPHKEIFSETEVVQNSGCGVGSLFLFSGLSAVATLAMAEYWNYIFTPGYGLGVVTGAGIVGASSTIYVAGSFWKREEVVPKTLTRFEKQSIYGSSLPPSNSESGDLIGDIADDLEEIKVMLEASESARLKP